MVRDKATLRHRLYLLTECPHERTRGRRVVDGALALLIVATTIATTVESVPEHREAWGWLLLWVEIVGVTVFLTEYLVRLWVTAETDDARRDGTARARWAYVVSPMGLIDLAAIFPSLIALVTGLGAEFLSLRLVRILRILKLARYSPALESLGNVFWRERRSFMGAGLIVVVLLFAAATAMHMVEGKAQPEAFGTLADSLWWAVITLTTTGYGDVVPKTGAGRILGGVCSILGLCLLALPAGIIASGFADEIKRRDFVVSVRLLSSVPLFAHLDVNRLVDLATMLKPLTVGPLFTVVRRGDMADCMYFIVSGELEVETPKGPVRLTPGSFFGEMGLLTGAPRSARVTSVTDTQLLVLYDTDFTTLMTQHPEMRATVARVAEERMAGAGPTSPPG